MLRPSLVAVVTVALLGGGRARAFNPYEVPQSVADADVAEAPPSPGGRAAMATWRNDACVEFGDVDPDACPPPYPWGKAWRQGGGAASATAMRGYDTATVENDEFCAGDVAIVEEVPISDECRDFASFVRDPVGKARDSARWAAAVARGDFSDDVVDPLAGRTDVLAAWPGVPPPAPTREHPDGAPATDDAQPPIVRGRRRQRDEKAKLAQQVAARGRDGAGNFRCDVADVTEETMMEAFKDPGRFHRPMRLRGPLPERLDRAMHRAVLLYCFGDVRTMVKYQSGGRSKDYEIEVPFGKYVEKDLTRWVPRERAPPPVPADDTGSCKPDAPEADADAEAAEASTAAARGLARRRLQRRYMLHAYYASQDADFFGRAPFGALLRHVAKGWESLNTAFGVQAPGGGLQIHQHNAVFATTYRGAKRWYLANASGAKPPMHDDHTMAEWAAYELPAIRASEKLQLDAAAAAARAASPSTALSPGTAGYDAWLAGVARAALPHRIEECVTRPGDVLFLPHMMWHGTVNLAETILFAIQADNPPQQAAHSEDAGGGTGGGAPARPTGDPLNL